VVRGLHESSGLHGLTRSESGPDRIGLEILDRLLSESGLISITSEFGLGKFESCLIQ
jgi:hypothetical protein